MEKIFSHAIDYDKFINLNAQANTISVDGLLNKVYFLLKKGSGELMCLDKKYPEVFYKYKLNFPDVTRFVVYDNTVYYINGQSIMCTGLTNIGETEIKIGKPISDIWVQDGYIMYITSPSPNSTKFSIINVYSITEKKVLNTFDNGSIVSYISLDGDKLATASKFDSSLNVKVWSLSENKQINIIESDDGSLSAFSLKGDHLAFVSSNEKLKVLSIKNNSVLYEKSLNHYVGNGNVILYNKFLIYCTNDGILSVVSTENWKVIHEQKITTPFEIEYVYMKINIDGKIAILLRGTRTYDFLVELWDASPLLTDSEDYIAQIHAILKNPSTDIENLYSENSSRYTTLDVVSDKIKSRIKDEETGKYECPITAETLTENSEVAITKCNHIMSKDAMEEWKKTGRTNGNLCPICRQDPGVLKKLTRKERVMEKILFRWEKKLNKARDVFFNTAKINMSISNIIEFAKTYKNDIILQDVIDKEKKAAEEVLKWYLLFDKSNDENKTNKRARSGASIKDLPPIRIIRPNI
jgi:hypothetical protein